MYTLLKLKSKKSSRRQIDIKGAKDGILLLPNNRYRSILKVSSLNFELKSEEEQDILIDTYESFLNSLGGPLQVLIRTREVDMDKYINELEEKLSIETEDIYKVQLQSYCEFISGLVSTNKILTRHFYIIVPYDSVSKSDFKMVKEQLKFKTDIVSRGLLRLGMHSSELSSLEVLDLFYSFYNPEQSKVQPLTDKALQLIQTSFIQKEVI
jgi:hypothetical protein